jgi:hypothetical protein
MSWLWLAVAHAVPTLSVPSPVDGLPLVVEVTGASGPVAVLASTGVPLPPGSDLGPTLRLLDPQWLGVFTPGLAGDVTTSVALPPGSAGRTFTLVAADATGPSAPVVITVAPDPLSNLPDSDLDGLPDALEDQFYAYGYDPDTDDDGLTDGDEVFVHHTAPNVPDSDSDGLSDAAEVTGGTDPTQWDTDGGGASDGEEVTAGTDPHDDADDDHAGSDYDQDGLPDRIEQLLGTRLWDPTATRTASSTAPRCSTTAPTPGGPTPTATTCPTRPSSSGGPTPSCRTPTAAAPPTARSGTPPPTPTTTPTTTTPAPTGTRTACPTGSRTSSAPACGTPTATWTASSTAPRCSTTAPTPGGPTPTAAANATGTRS